MQRTLSKQEAEAIRLVHHDFMGLPRSQAAERMDISEQRLSSILQSAKKKAPHLFPILTQNQNVIYKAIVEKGYDRKTMAYYLNQPINKVDAIIAQLRKKGVSLTVPKTVRYEPHMDRQVKRRF